MEEKRPRRDRKQVEFFQPAPITKDAEVTIPNGNGTKIGDIPNTVYRLKKYSGKSEQMKQLHQLLLRVPGKANERKPNLLKFNGYASKDKDEQRQRLNERASKLFVPFVNELLDLFDIPRGSGDKESKVKLLVEFFLAPKMLSEKNIELDEGRKKAKKKASSAKRKRPATKSDEKSKKRGKGASGKTQTAEESGDDEEEAQQEDGSDGEQDDGKMPKWPALKKATLKVMQEVDVEQASLKQVIAMLEEQFGVNLKAEKQRIRGLVIDQVNMRQSAAETKTSKASKKPAPKKQKQEAPKTSKAQKQADKIENDDEQEEKDDDGDDGAADNGEEQQQEEPKDSQGAEAGDEGQGDDADAVEVKEDDKDKEEGGSNVEEAGEEQNGVKEDDE